MTIYPDKSDGDVLYAKELFKYFGTSTGSDISIPANKVDNFIMVFTSFDVSLSDLGSGSASGNIELKIGEVGSEAVVSSTSFSFSEGSNDAGGGAFPGALNTIHIATSDEKTNGMNIIFKFNNTSSGGSASVNNTKIMVLGV